jgi:hypothetical protein
LVNARSRKWLLVTAGVIGLLVVAGVLFFHIAARTLKDDVLKALGPESEVADLTVGLTRIVISGIRINAPKGWPTDSTLTAERVEIVPDLRQLLSRRIYVTKVAIENGYISALRPKNGGGLKVLPTILDERKKENAEENGRTGTIKTVELTGCTIELYDATTSKLQKVRIDDVHGTIKDIEIPKLESRSPVDLSGIIKGKAHRGTIAIGGWVNVGDKSSELTTRVRNVDLALFESYITQKTKAGIDQGTFNLDVKAAVRKNVVAAHGELTLAGLKFEQGEGALGGFTNLPQRAVIGALKNDQDQVKIGFELNGDLDNPDFSLSKGLGLEAALAILKGLGLGFEALIRAFFVMVSGFGAAF